jgi:hypothetical protein
MASQEWPLPEPKEPTYIMTTTAAERDGDEESLVRDTRQPRRGEKELPVTLVVGTTQLVENGRIKLIPVGKRGSGLETISDVDI